MAARRERGLLDPDAAPGESVFDHTVCVVASDGDLQEGVTSEASSLAGHQELGNLVVVYDQNHISIEDDTDIAFTEDVARAVRGVRLAHPARRLDHRRRSDGYDEDVEALNAALDAARRRDRHARRSSSLRTVIAWPAPNAQNTGKSHGSALGEEEIRGHQGGARLRPGRRRSRSTTTCSRTPARSSTAAARAHAALAAAVRAWREQNPDARRAAGPAGERRLPAGWADALPTFRPARTSRPARRPATSSPPGAACCPSCGAARPTWPRATTRRWRASPRSCRAGRATECAPGDPYGRTLHFGIREHAMGSILNGIALHGGTRAYGGTFLVFSDYMRPPVRLAALMGLPVDLRVDARLHRPRRGRPDPPAGRAPRRAAGDPRAGRRAARRTRTRPPGRGGRSSARRPAGRALPDPAERADVPAR